MPPWLRRIVNERRSARQVRTNVDLVVSDVARVQTWLAVLPDTYRLRAPDSFAASPEFEHVSPAEAVALEPSPGDTVLVADQESSDRLGKHLVRPLSETGIAAAIAGVVSAPSRWRRGTEPAVTPLAVAVRGSTWIDVGGAPSGPDPLPGLMGRLRDAGHHLALLPAAGEPRRAPRSDPITEAAVVIVSAVPMHDVGGGSRGAQLALELLRHGYHVAHVAVFGSGESVDLGLRFVHPRLEQYRLADFAVRSHLDRVDHPGVVIVEIPEQPLVADLELLKRVGWKIVYDLIDDWSDPALGSWWYRRAVEDRIVELADGLTASAADLLSRLGAADAMLVPNAVNEPVFSVENPPAPPDLPGDAQPILGYHGSLYGDWFDWDGLAAVARSFPDAHVVILGDHRQQQPALPPNVHLLGLKPQVELPDYVQRFRVGLIPFVVSATTHAVSPLKVYEYLASGVPVAASPLHSLAGLSGVYTSDDLVDAVTLAMAAPRPERGSVLRDHSWGRRLTDLLATVGLKLGPIADRDGARIVRRPVVHYRDRERRL